MIRLVHLLRRRDGAGETEFKSWWRDEHGPLVAFHQKRLEILRYVQTHGDPAAAEGDQRAAAARGGMEAAYDGVSEYWWPGEQALAGALQTEQGRHAMQEIVADEQRFVDGAASPLWFAHEYPQVSVLRERAVARPKTGIMKVHFAMRPKAELGFEQAQHYWRTVHGPLLRLHAPARGMLCYQQVHRFDTPLADSLCSMRGSTVEPYMGHAEAWYDRLSSPAGPEANDASAAAIADERNFADLRRTSMMTGKELVFIDRNWI